MNKIISKDDYLNSTVQSFKTVAGRDMSEAEFGELSGLLDKFFKEEAKEPEHAKDDKPKAAGIVFMSPDGKVLLLKRADSEANYGGHWGLPGGKAEAGESSADAAMREAREETGYSSDFDLMSELNKIVTPKGMEFTTFLVKEKEEFTPRFEDGEHTDFVWTGLDELPEPIHPGVKETLMKLKGSKGATDALTFDKDSVRTLDSAGRMHVALANISKACVNPYFGKEIPGWEMLGLNPEQLYQMLRDPEELAKAAKTFDGIQLLIRHIPVNAVDHRPDDIVGATGTSAEFDGTFLTNELVIWTQEGITLVESGLQQELSCGYGYIPVMEPGVFKGEKYDGRMTNIEGNHVALVSKGRAGPDVMVGDAAIKIEKEPEMTKPLSRTAVRVQAALSVFMMPKIAMDSQLKYSLALGTALSQLGASEKITRAALKKDNFRAAIIKMAKDAAEPMMTPEAKKAGAGPDDVIMRVLDMVDGQMAAETEGAEGEDDSEGVSEPEPKAGGEGGLRKKVMDALVAKGMDEAGCAEIMDMLPAETEDAEGAEPPKKKEGEEAEDDNTEEKEEEKKKAMDAAIEAARKGATADTMKVLQEIRKAEKAVAPLIGEVSVAMDSASDIYRAALKAHDISTEGVHETALPAMVDMLVRSKENASKRVIANDAAVNTGDDRKAFDTALGINSRPIRNLGAA